MKTKVFFSVLIGVIFCISAYAQEVAQAQKNMMQFVGKWTSNDIKLTLGDKTYTGIYTFDCVAVNDKTGVLAHEKFENRELGTMLAENLLGYDPNLQLVHIYTIDNMGTAHDHVGNWIGNNHLFVQYQGVADGKILVEQIDMMFSSPDKLVLKLTAMQNGEVFEQVSATFVK